MRSGLSSSRRGLTLVELLIAIAFLPILIVLVQQGVRLANAFSREFFLNKVQQDAQMALYEFTEDVRNSDRMDVFVTSVSLRAFNPRIGFAKEETFQEVNIGTVTYSFQGTGKNAHLLRTATFNAVPSLGIPVYNQQQKMLQGIIATSSFSKYPSTVVGSRSNGVEIKMSLTTGMLKKEKPYKATVLRRSGVAT